LLRSGKKTLKTLERIGRVYGWNERALSSITDDDAAAMLHDIAVERGKKAAANQTKHILHTLFKWARQPGRKFTAVNPFSDLAAPGGVRPPRARFLSAIEIRQVWQALDQPERFKVSRDAATALRLILVTAARPGMVARMIGSELRDLTGPSEHGPHWSLSAERMKAGSPFITPLTGLALELLRPYPYRDPNERLFKQVGGRNQLHEAAKRIVDGLGMQRWTPHDLRRTAATILDWSGYSLEQIGAILAHTRKGVTAVYARWNKFDLRREMAMVIERSLRETLSETPEAALLAA
jgi:integrase